MAVDLSGLDSDQRGQVISGLNDFTGNTYSVNAAGLLKLNSVGVGSSPTATDFLNYIIGLAETATITANNQNPAFIRGRASAFSVEIDFSDLDAFSYKNVDEAAFGLGSSVVHELDHAFFGNPHSRAERSGEGPLGETVGLVNLIRAERGFGERLEYPFDSANRLTFGYSVSYPKPSGIKGVFSGQPSVKLKPGNLDK
jgi:hypothetical protein